LVAAVFASVLAGIAAVTVAGHPSAAPAAATPPVVAPAAARPVSAQHVALSQPRVVSTRAFVVGDSLTVGTEPWLPAALRNRGWTLSGVNARVGRGVPEGLDVLRRRASRLPSTVVVALGTNNLPSTKSDFTRWLRAARDIVGARTLVWVNLCLNDTGRPWLRHYHRINTWLADLAPRFRIRVADWCGFATSHHIAPGPDGIHYSPTAYRQRAAYYARVLSTG
jgi:lysophospholipase L1-like esterase